MVYVLYVPFNPYIRLPLRTIRDSPYFPVVSLSVIASPLFSEPQFGYGFGAGVVGLITGVGPLIGALLGNVIAGPLSDWTVKWMSRKNGGVYEPESVLAGRPVHTCSSLDYILT